MQKTDGYKLDVRPLRVFLSVCRTSSFSRTAAEFDVTQSTISHIIDKLRAAFKDPLFVKSDRGIVPSERALALLPRVTAILSDLDGLVLQDTYDPDQERRPFVLAISSPSSPSLLEEMKETRRIIARRAERASLIIRRHAPRDTIEEVLSEDRGDAVVAVAGNRYPPTLNSTSYATDDLAVFYDPACRGPIEGLDDYLSANHGVIDFGGHIKSEVEKAFDKSRLTRRVVMAAPTSSMLGELERRTDVVVTMPSRLASGAYRHLASCEPPLDLPRVAFDLVWHRRYECSGRSLWFRGVVLEARETVRGGRAADARVNVDSPPLVPNV